MGSRAACIVIFLAFSELAASVHVKDAATSLIIESAGDVEENPNDDANMVSGDGDDDSFVQVASKKVSRKGDGFDGFGAPDPFNQNDDDEVDQGEPNAPEKENPNDDANMVSDEDANDDDE